MKPLQYNLPHTVMLAAIGQSLGAAGFRIRQSFSLEDVLTAGTPCTLHSAETCDSAMTVLLIYGDEPQPATLIVQGHNDQSWVSLDQSYGQRISAEFQATILTSVAQATNTNSYA